MPVSHALTCSEPMHVYLKHQYQYLPGDGWLTGSMLKQKMKNSLYETTETIQD